MKSTGHPDAVFSANQPVGENTIRRVLTDALVLVGHPGAKGHALRRLFITTLANDPRVSIQESMNAARHSSVAALRPYIRVDGESEKAKFLASGLKK